MRWQPRYAPNAGVLLAVSRRTSTGPCNEERLSSLDCARIIWTCKPSVQAKCAEMRPDSPLGAAGAATEADPPDAAPVFLIMVNEDRGVGTGARVLDPPQTATSASACGRRPNRVCRPRAQTRSGPGVAGRRDPSSPASPPAPPLVSRRALRCDPAELWQVLDSRRDSPCCRGRRGAWLRLGLDDRAHHRRSRGSGLARACAPVDDSSVEIAALDTRGPDPDGHPSLVRRTKRIGVLPEILLRQAVDLLVRALVDERRSPAH